MDRFPQKRKAFSFLWLSEESLGLTFNDAILIPEYQLVGELLFLENHHYNCTFGKEKTSRSPKTVWARILLWCTYCALALQNHEDTVVIFMIVHVVLNSRFAVDHPCISKTSSPQTQMPISGWASASLIGFFISTIIPPCSSNSFHSFPFDV